MKTFALIFAWLPIAMAFMGSGQEGAGYVWNSLLLLWFGVEVCAATFRHHADESELLIKLRIHGAAVRAFSTGDTRLARQHLLVWELFSKRGAS